MQDSKIQSGEDFWRKNRILLPAVPIGNISTRFWLQLASLRSSSAQDYYITEFTGKSAII
jgi:hypothetical protein